MPTIEEEKERTWEDHLAAAIKAFRREMMQGGDFLPGEFHTHRRAAQKEMLLAWRSLIDARISKLDAAEKEKSTPKVTKITVE